MIDDTDAVVQVSPAQYISGVSSPHNPLDFKVLGAFPECSGSEKSELICENLRFLTQSGVSGTSKITNFHLVLTGTTWNYIRVNFPSFVPMVSSLILLRE